VVELYRLAARAFNRTRRTAHHFRERFVHIEKRLNG
jgi:hypothetical protein